MPGSATSSSPRPPEIQAWIDALGLEPHPEGGAYAETWRATSTGGHRPAGSSIYYLLEAGQVSQWHRVDAAEIWHFYAGGLLELWTFQGDGPAEGAPGPDLGTLQMRLLGTELSAGARPQLRVEPGHWQRVVTRGAYTLVGCTVSPAFEFEKFELAPTGWGIQA